MVNHAMLDLETLSTENNAVVLTIGGCKFNPFKDTEPFEKVHLKIDTTEQIERGRHIEDSTLKWWGTQPTEVKEAAFSEEGRCTVKEAHDYLHEWIKDCNKIWCQGPSFDFPIMKSLFREIDLDVPWKFWLERDARTITGLVPENLKEKIDFAAHNAVEDCIAQSKCVQYVYRQLDIHRTF